MCVSCVCESMTITYCCELVISGHTKFNRNRFRNRYRAHKFDFNISFSTHLLRLIADKYRYKLDQYIAWEYDQRKQVDDYDQIHPTITLI